MPEREKGKQHKHWLWNISACWGEFSLLETGAYTLEETLYWTFLTGWVLGSVNQVYHKRKQTPAMLRIGLDALLHNNFRYAKEKCAWLEKQAFLNALKMVYHSSLEVLGDTNPCNPEWLYEAEAGCRSFFEHYTFCKDRLKNPMLVRLNQFEPDENVWYLIRDEDTLYFLWLRDFG